MDEGLGPRAGGCGPACPVWGAVGTAGLKARRQAQRPRVGAQGRKRGGSCPGETDVGLNAETCLAPDKYL